MHTTPNELEEQILDLCRQGKKLEAIKRYRDATDKGLKESKDYVDQLARAHGIKAPEGTGACFIATACYGDYDALEVLVLRQFRDDQLLTSRMGRMLVRFYYFVSPSLARVIAKSGWFKALVRKYFLTLLVAKLQQQRNNKG